MHQMIVKGYRKGEILTESKAKEIIGKSKSWKKGIKLSILKWEQIAREIKEGKRNCDLSYHRNALCGVCFIAINKLYHPYKDEMCEVCIYDTEAECMKAYTKKSSDYEGAKAMVKWLKRELKKYKR